jgi:peroxiredoxin
MDAPLNVRLKYVADAVERLSPEFARAVERMVARLADNGVGLSAPDVGEAMPEFVLPDETGRLVSLSQLISSGPVVVSFNRGHWCPYCSLNVDALAKAQPEIARLGAEIVAISPETVQWSAALKAYAKAPFSILSDVDGGYALELNLLFWVGDEKRAALAAGGIDLVQFQGNETWMLPIPATFVVDRGGNIRARHVDPDYRRRMEIDELLAAVAQATE